MCFLPAKRAKLDPLCPLQYNDFDQRDAHRAASAASRDWQDGYLAFSRPHVSHQESSIFAPAAGVLAAAGAAPIARYTPPPRQPGKQPLYELRQYQVGLLCVQRL
jgi:hypothetical protein